MNRDSAWRSPTSPFHLTRVDPCADPKTEGRDRVADGERAPDCRRRPVEDREETISRRVDLIAPEAIEFRPHGLVMCLQYAGPGLVTDLPNDRGRADEVREENRREDTVAHDRWPVPVRNS